MSDKNGQLLHHARNWNTGYSSTADLEEAAVKYARSIGPIGKQDVMDMQRCINFRIKELRYAVEPRNMRYLNSLDMTVEDAFAEIERMSSLLSRVECLR